MEILTLGILEIRHEGRRLEAGALGGRMPKQVLELLVAARGRPVLKDQLIDQMWADRQPRHPTAALENHVWVLRRHLVDAMPREGDVVIAGPRSYRLDTDRVWLDLDGFDALMTAAGRATATAARANLDEALALVRGDLFADEPYAEWAVPLRETVRIRVAHAHLQSAALALEQDDPVAAIQHAEAVLQVEPLNEHAGGLKMLALARLGDRHQAAEVFESFREALRTQLHVDPLPETISIHEAIRHAAEARAMRLSWRTGVSRRLQEARWMLEEGLISREQYAQVTERVLGEL